MSDITNPNESFTGTADVEYLDGEFTITEKEPGTLGELSSLVGEAAVLDSANADLRYRNKYPRVYKKVSAALVGFGFARAVAKSATRKDGTVKETLESTNDHIRAALNGRKVMNPETNEEVTVASGISKEQLTDLFVSIAPNEPLYVKGERTGGGGKVSKEVLETAEKHITDGTEDKVVEIIESMTPGYKVGRDAEGNVTAESLARGIQALDKHLKKQAPSALSVLKG